MMSAADLLHSHVDVKTVISMPQRVDIRRQSDCCVEWVARSSPFVLGEELEAT